MKMSKVLTGIGTVAGVAAVTGAAAYMMTSKKPMAKKMRYTASKTASNMMKK